MYLQKLGGARGSTPLRWGVLGGNPEYPLPEGSLPGTHTAN